MSNQLNGEILEQPEALRRLRHAYVDSPDPRLAAAAELIRNSRHVIMAGMATSEYACFSASGWMSQGGINNQVYDVSELMYYHLNDIQPDSCLVLVSQSGNSAEVVHVLEELSGRIPVIGVFNYEDSFLARSCEIPLPIYAGPQLACGSKTNLNSIALLLLLADAALGRDLEPAGQTILSISNSIERIYEKWQDHLSPAVNLLEDSAYTVFLGRGPGRATAMFSACLFREVPKWVAEGMGAAAFRHGLREMIKPAHRVVIFAPAGRTFPLLVKMAQDTLDLGVPVVMVANQLPDLPASENFVLIHTDRFEEEWSPVLDMVPMQLAGFTLAERSGLEPGKLVISTNVTIVE